MKKTALLTAALLMLGGAQSTFAQQGLATKISDARKANAVLMKKYSWHSRTEVVDKGKVADVRIELVTYGPTGELQRTLLNDEKSPLPRGFIRRRLAEKEREKVEKYLVGLRKVLDQYTLPTAGKVLDFVDQATIQAPDANGMLQLTGTSVITPGDAFTLTVAAATGQTQKIAVTTTFEGDQVTATASFTTLASGLTHLEFGEVIVSAKEMTLQLHNFAYNSNN